MAKIAILYETLGRSKGGIEAWIFSASEELFYQGHQVTLFYVNNSELSDATPSNVSLVKLKPHVRFKTFDFYSQIWSLYFQLKDVLSTFDMVWARSFTMAWAGSTILGKGKVVYVNAAPYAYYGQITFKEKIRKSMSVRDYLRAISSDLSLRIAYQLEKRAIQRCKNVFLSKARKVETLEYFNLDENNLSCSVVPAGVNINRFFPSEEKEYKDSYLKIITVCRLAPDKNVQCVLRAMKELICLNIPSTLTIVGAGDFEFYLKQLATDLRIDNCVSFVGRQENVELWYRKNDVFVLPSLYEGFGSVYIEAMASGLPCIAISNKSGKFSVASDEIIINGVTGFLMFDNDIMELKSILMKIHFNRLLLKQMSYKAREIAEKSFNWKKSINKLLDISMK
jgi:glycosyltransferase involved in cell wall biosynthesis